MAIRKETRDIIIERLKKGYRISDISKELKISRESIRTIRDVEFGRTEGTKKSKEILGIVGDLDPVVLKERLQAGEIAIRLCKTNAMLWKIPLDTCISIITKCGLNAANIEIENRHLKTVIEAQKSIISRNEA